MVKTFNVKHPSLKRETNFTVSNLMTRIIFYLIANCTLKQYVIDLERYLKSVHASFAGINDYI